MLNGGSGELVEVCYVAMEERDLDDLAAALHTEQVYQYIGGMPSLENFKLGLQRAMRGPPATRRGERWLNYVARLSSTGQLIGRLEATVHDGLAEVAFLYGQQHWGKGFATHGLLWLHRQLHRVENVASLWATTVPANSRSSALLQRCGYVQIPTTDLPRLYSYDLGDTVFTRNSAA